MPGYSINRRQVLVGAGIGAVGGYVGHHPTHDLTEDFPFLGSTPNIKVEDVLAEQSLKKPDPDEAVPIIAQIRNEEDTEQSIDVTLLASRNGNVTHRITKRLENIPPHKARPATFRFEGPPVSLVETWTYDFRIQLNEVDSDHIITKTGVKESVSYNSTWKDIRIWLSREAQLMEMGAHWGDWGSVYKVPGTSTLSYFAGWLSASVAPGVEVAVDVRDCTVKNDAWWENRLDCAGATMSVTATGLQITSAAGIVFPEPKTTLAGAIGLVYAKILDWSEDVRTAAKVVGKFLKRNEHHVSKVVRFLQKTFDTPFVRKVENKLDDLGFERVARLVGKVRGVALKVNEVRWADKPAILKKWNYEATPSKSGAGHIKAYREKYLNKEGIQKALKNADKGWEQRFKQNGDQVTIRILVRTIQEGKYDIVKLYDDVGEWRITNAWNNVGQSFLKSRKKRYALEEGEQLHKSTSSKSIRVPL